MQLSALPYPVASTVIELASIELVSIMKSAQVDSTGVFYRSTTTVGVGSFGLAALGLNLQKICQSVIGTWALCEPHAMSLTRSCVM